MKVKRRDAQGRKAKLVKAKLINEPMPALKPRLIESENDPLDTAIISLGLMAVWMYCLAWFYK